MRLLRNNEEVLLDLPRWFGGVSATARNLGFDPRKRRLFLFYRQRRKTKTYEVSAREKRSGSNEALPQAAQRSPSRCTAPPLPSIFATCRKQLLQYRAGATNWHRRATRLICRWLHRVSCQARQGETATHARTKLLGGKNAQHIVTSDPHFNHEYQAPRLTRRKTSKRARIETHEGG